MSHPTAPRHLSPPLQIRAVAGVEATAEEYIADRTCSHADHTGNRTNVRAKSRETVGESEIEREHRDQRGVVIHGLTLNYSRHDQPVEIKQATGESIEANLREDSVVIRPVVARAVTEAEPSP